MYWRLQSSSHFEVLTSVADVESVHCLIATSSWCTTCPPRCELSFHQQRWSYASRSRDCWADVRTLAELIWGPRCLSLLRQSLLPDTWFPSCDRLTTTAWALLESPARARWSLLSDGEKETCYPTSSSSSTRWRLAEVVKLSVHVYYSSWSDCSFHGRPWQSFGKCLTWLRLSCWCLSTCSWLWNSR